MMLHCSTFSGRNLGAGDSCRSVFRGLVVTCMSCFLSNLVSGSVRPLMYRRVANPRIGGGSTHLKNIHHI